MGVSNTSDTLRPRSSAASMEGTTDLSSAATSVKENEKKMDAPSEAVEERQNSAEEFSELPLGEKIREATQVAVAQDSSAEDGSDDVEYPAGWKLALITVALCLSVFCMALVWRSLSNYKQSLMSSRTTPSLLPPSLVSPINSRPSMMSVGMVAHICSQLAPSNSSMAKSTRCSPSSGRTWSPSSSSS